MKKNEVDVLSNKTLLFGESQLGLVDLGLKLQNHNRSFPCIHHNDGNDDDDGGGGSRVKVSGPPLMSDIYDVTLAATSYSPHPFKPSGGGMPTTTVGFPFTATQWKELERQAMIYKYMVASLPVPPTLLYSSFQPTSSTFAPASYLAGKYGNGLNFRWVGNSKDAEPGRCRRTDGKKWRCSRDVAPNQKYCERHMHRGKPRSRKPVELVHQPNSVEDFPVGKVGSGKKTRLNDPNPQPVFGSSCFGSVSASKGFNFYQSVASGANPFEDSRSLAWTEEQQWQQLMQTNMNPHQIFNQHYEGEPLNLSTHTSFNTKPNMSLLERPLIDAWSMGNKDDCGNNNKASFSNTMDDEMCQIHMGLGVLDPWSGSAPSPGGPLAEVLRPANSDAGEGDFITPTATAVSSPSGVLQKTLASFSDSSGSSSPTGHNSKAKSDMPFHWLN